MSRSPCGIRQPTILFPGSEETAHRNASSSSISQLPVSRPQSSPHPAARSPAKGHGIGPRRPNMPTWSPAWQRPAIALCVSMPGTVWGKAPEGTGPLPVEAELTGRLDHPGIVPVYGLGRDAQGQPFSSPLCRPGTMGPDPEVEVPLVREFSRRMHFLCPLRGSSAAATGVRGTRHHIQPRRRRTSRKERR
jgi:hypothetical protein